MSPSLVYVSRGTSVRYVEPHARFTAADLDAFLDEHQCDDVTINQVYGRGQADFEEALKSKRIKRLSLVLDSASLSELANNRHVEIFYFSGFLKEVFDFSRAKKLVSLAIQWQNGIEGLDRMPCLEELSLRSFRGDVVLLEKLNFLTTLALIEPNITSLQFLQSYGSLKKLEVSYAKKLTNIDGLLSLKSTLRELEFDHLPKLGVYAEILSHLKKLTKLRITKCPPLQNLDFVKDLKDLEFFSFVDTNVLSGDLTPCTGLKYVGFLDKKNYNCTWDRTESRLERKSVF